jgi:hypothetical protein
MSESLFSRAAVAEAPAPAAQSAAEPTYNARAEAPRGVALRRTVPSRSLVEAPAETAAELGADLARLAVDRATPAPRHRGWLSWLGGSR